MENQGLINVLSAVVLRNSRITLVDFLSFFAVFTGLELRSGGNIKKIILIVLAILLLGAGMYFIFFFKAKVSITIEPNNAQIEVADKVGVGNLKVRLMPGKHRLKISSDGYIVFDQEITTKISQTISFNIKLRAQPKPEKITNYPMQFVTFTQDGKDLLYLSNNGKTIYKLNSASSDQPQTPYAITPDVFSAIQDIIWNPNKELAIIKNTTGNTSLYDFNRYDLLHQENFDWGADIKGIAWRSDGEKTIYYYAPASGEQSLIRADKNNSAIEKILDMRPYNLGSAKISWSADQQKVLLLTSKIYLFDVYTKTITPLEQVTEVTQAQFTPDSQQIIYQNSGSIYLLDLSTKAIEDLGIKTTLDRIVWLDQTNFIYAETIDDKDQFAKYNLTTKEKITYDYNTEQNLKATNLLLSANPDKLFFISNSYLYSLKLENKQY